MVAMAAKHHATPVVVLTGALNHEMLKQPPPFMANWGIR